jgi:hypothetical protein
MLEGGQRSWKFAVLPAAIGFVAGNGLGSRFRGTCSWGRDAAHGRGHLFHFELAGSRRKIAVDDSRLRDRVADNAAENDITGSERLLIGSDFGVGTNIETWPNGSLLVVSLTKGAISRSSGGSRSADGAERCSSAPTRRSGRYPGPAPAVRRPRPGPLRDAHAGHLVQRHRKRRCTMHVGRTTGSPPATTRALGRCLAQAGCR